MKRFSRIGPPVESGPSNGTSGIPLLVITVLSVAALLAMCIYFGVTGGNSNCNGVKSLEYPSSSAPVCSGSEDRHQAAYKLRVDAATVQYARGVPCHVSNGDEQRYATRNYFSQFSKGLQHDENAEGIKTVCKFKDRATV